MLMVRVNLIISIWWHLIFCLFDLKKKRIFHKKKTNNNITIITKQRVASCATRARLGFYINGMDLDIIIYSFINHTLAVIRS